MPKPRRSAISRRSVEISRTPNCMEEDVMISPSLPRRTQGAPPGHPRWWTFGPRGGAALAAFALVFAPQVGERRPVSSARGAHPLARTIGGSRGLRRGARPQPGEPREPARRRSALDRRALPRHPSRRVRARRRARDAAHLGPRVGASPRLRAPAGRRRLPVQRPRLHLAYVGRRLSPLRSPPGRRNRSSGPTRRTPTPTTSSGSAPASRTG